MASRSLPASSAYSSSVRAGCAPLPMIAIFAVFTAFSSSAYRHFWEMTGAEHKSSAVSQTFDDLGHDSSSLDRQSQIAQAFDTANRIHLAAVWASSDRRQSSPCRPRRQRTRQRLFSRAS